MEEDAPRANERTKERTKRRESPWRQLLHPPTHPTVHCHRQPANSIGGAHHPRSVVSTRQAATCCDSTPLTHGTGPFDRLSDGAITLHHRPAHSELPDPLRSRRMPQTHTHIHSPHSLSINRHRAEAC